jgi:hypothetical protein
MRSAPGVIDTDVLVKAASRETSDQVKRQVARAAFVRVLLLFRFGQAGVA